MSRHEVPAKDPNHLVIVGWDPPLLTYFAQVIDRQKERAGDDDKFVLWVGTELREIDEVDQLARQVSRYAEIPADLAATLSGEESGTGAEPGVGEEAVTTVNFADTFVIALDCDPMPPRYFDGRFSSGALWHGELEPSTVASQQGAYPLRHKPRAEQLAQRLAAHFGGQWSVVPVAAASRGAR